MESVANLVGLTKELLIAIICPLLLLHLPLVEVDVPLKEVLVAQLFDAFLDFELFLIAFIFIEWYSFLFPSCSVSLFPQDELFPGIVNGLHLVLQLTNLPVINGDAHGSRRITA